MVLVLVVDYITLHHSRETVFPQICHNNLKIDINYKNEKRENNEKRIGEYPGLYYTEGVLLNGRRILKQSVHTIIAIIGPGDEEFPCIKREFPFESQLFALCY